MARPREFDPNDVLKTAVDVFWEKGYHNGSVDEVVKRSGVAKYGIYGTFGTKRELFLQALCCLAVDSTAHVYSVSVSCFSARDPDGLFARQLPIALSCFEALRHSRVLPAPVRPVRHRSACFAIVVVEGPPRISQSYSISRSRHATRRPLRLIVGVMSNHRPGHSGRLVRPRHRRYIRMTSRGELLCPNAQPVVLVSGCVQRRAPAVYEQAA